MAAALSSAPRSIGGAMRRNPWDPEVPCHRVIAANGASLCHLSHLVSAVNFLCFYCSTLVVSRACGMKRLMGRIANSSLVYCKKRGWSLIRKGDFRMIRDGGMISELEIGKIWRRLWSHFPNTVNDLRRIWEFDLDHSSGLGVRFLSYQQEHLVTPYIKLETGPFSPS